MLTQWIRTIFDDNTVLTDFSLESQNREAFALPIIAADDSIYIGQYFPFNNVYFEMDTVNDQASVLSIDYVSGFQWKPAIDVIDGTKATGVSLAKSGIVQFSPDEFSWSKVSDPRKLNNSSLGIESLAILDLYWIRIKFSADLNAATAVKSLAYNFTTDRLLESIDPEIDQYKSVWESGKTNWVEQSMLATQHMIADLKSKGLIIAPGNILRFDDVSLATTYRTLMVIYSVLGPDFVDKFNSAMKNYGHLTDIKRFTFDKNQDGKVNDNEISLTVAQGVR